MTTIAQPILTEDEEIYTMWHTSTCEGCDDVGIDHGYFYIGDSTMAYAYCDSCVWFLKKTKSVKKF